MGRELAGWLPEGGGNAAERERAEEVVGVVVYGWEWGVGSELGATEEKRWLLAVVVVVLVVASDALVYRAAVLV